MVITTQRCQTTDCTGSRCSADGIQLYDSTMVTIHYDARQSGVSCQGGGGLGGVEGNRTDLLAEEVGKVKEKNATSVTK